MTADLWQLGSAALLVVLAGLFSAADAALNGFSRARAEELRAEGRAGAKRLVQILDDPPRYLNTALLLRLLCEISAIVLVSMWARDAYHDSLVPSVLTTIGVMLVVSFVVIGVAPRTLGRQHDARVALLSAGPLSLVTTILGPDPGAADPARQRDHPGPRLQRGTVLHRDRAARAGRPRRGLRGHRVGRAPDDPLRLRARRHHHPRGDGPAPRRGLHRAPQEHPPDALALPAQRLLAHPGHRREPRRHRRHGLPQGPRPP